MDKSILRVGPTTIDACKVCCNCIYCKPTRDDRFFRCDYYIDEYGAGSYIWADEIDKCRCDNFKPIMTERHECCDKRRYVENMIRNFYCSIGLNDHKLPEIINNGLDHEDPDTGYMSFEFVFEIEEYLSKMFDNYVVFGDPWCD